MTGRGCTCSVVAEGDAVARRSSPDAEDGAVPSTRRTTGGFKGSTFPWLRLRLVNFSCLALGLRARYPIFHRQVPTTRDPGPSWGRRDRR